MMQGFFGFQRRSISGLYEQPQWVENSQCTQLFFLIVKMNSCLKKRLGFLLKNVDTGFSLKFDPLFFQKKNGP